MAFFGGIMKFDLDKEGLAGMIREMGLAMDEGDIGFLQGSFQNEKNIH